MNKLSWPNKHRHLLPSFQAILEAPFFLIEGKIQDQDQDHENEKSNRNGKTFKKSTFHPILLANGPNILFDWNFQTSNLKKTRLVFPA